MVSLAAIALATPGFAGADPTATVVAGRQRIKVTVSGYPDPGQCLVDPDSERHTQSVAVGPSGSVVAHNIEPGRSHVLVWCPNGGVIYRGYVDVLPANPLLDLSDLLVANGSSGRVTDPTLQ
ncbi:hypothetical protein FOS14_02660 [Skermania sp. ID1734]|nr:hypothetical protein FOS14_02660 [Skermania sp. ID1734]